MKAIIIGAGRGRRLMSLTEDAPKCFAEIGGRRILDWILEAFSAAGIEEIVFVGGYQIEKVREAYPNFRFYYNKEWNHNNILVSLFCAEAEMDDGFVCTYSDILYRPSIVRSLMEREYDITLTVDTDWRARYTKRTLHPESDAEKVSAERDRIIQIGRHIDSDEAHGEYIGLAKFNRRGAEVLRTHYHRVRRVLAGRPFQDAPSVEKAYLIDLLQELTDQGTPMYKVDTEGGYMEIDTTQDYWIALKEWK